MTHSCRPTASGQAVPPRLHHTAFPLLNPVAERGCVFARDFGGRYFPHCLRSHLSLALPSATVCHCMLLGAPAPPQPSGRDRAATSVG
jgi:hypothetical protein